MGILGGDYMLITSGRREKSHGAHSISHIQNYEFDLLVVRLKHTYNKLRSPLQETSLILSILRVFLLLFSSFP